MVFMYMIFDLSFRDTIGLYGPPGLNRIVHGARFFLNKENVDFKVAECSAENFPTYQDDEITIKPVIVFPGSLNAFNAKSLLQPTFLSFYTKHSGSSYILYIHRT